MSQIRNLRTPILLGGAPISRVNREIFARCLGCWIVLSEDLMTRHSVSVRGLKARSDNFVRAILSADLIEILSFLEDLYACLITDKFENYTSFKHWCETRSLDVLDYRGLLSPIFPALIPFLEEDNRKENASLLASVSQFLRYPRKLEFQSIGLEDQALIKYLKTEEELAAVPNYDEDLVNSLSKIINGWFRDFHIENLRPNHGSGSVAEGPLTLAEKFHIMNTDKIVEILLRNHHEPSSYLEYFPVQPGTNLDRCSRTIFVPKTATKLRTISMEPTTLQYLQQGVMKELYRFIEKHPYLGVRIRLGDQTQNQVLALEGSIRHTYGTIDLSQASDTVSWDLVRRVFSKTPNLYKWLLATRSVCTLLPDGSRLQLKKFAPMGSALCFPIECIIFAAIVEHASSKVCTQTKCVQRIWSVYGDDLVVQSEAYDETIKCLKSCGFRVNDEKSYGSGNYRESCGKEYYAGYDITPLYYRIPYYSRRVSPSAFGSWCSSANNAFFHRLPLYRWYLIHKILDASPRWEPYFTVTPEMSPFLYSPQPTNHRSKIRWCRRYQREEGRFIVVKSKPRDSELDDESLAYFVKLVEMAWRDESRPSRFDEPQSPKAMHGSVEYFSSTVLPIEPRFERNLKVAVDWWETLDG